MRLRSFLWLMLISMAWAQYVPTIPATKTVASGPTLVQPTAGNFWAVTGSGCGIFGSSPTTCAFPSNVTSGNEIYILLIFGTTGTLAAPTVHSGSTATLGTIAAVGAGCNSGTNTCRGAQQWYRAAVTGSGSLSIDDVPPASNNMLVAVFEVSNDGGVDTGTNPVYGGNNSACTTTCNMLNNAGGITPATSGDLILYVYTEGNTNTLSAMTPWTLIGQNAASGNNLVNVAASYIAPSTSTVTGTFTQSSGQNFQEAAIAIK